MSNRFRRLTRAAIKQLQPGESLSENSIMAECTANGDIRYSVNAMVDGRRIHRAIGFASARVTLTQCEEFLEKARSDARAGRLSLPKGRKLALTVAAAAPQYLERLIQSDGKNLKVKRRHLCATSHLTKFFGAMRLDQITEFAIDRYKKARKAEGAAAGTINRELSTLGHLLRRAVKWKWVDSAPEIKRLTEEPVPMIALTDNECAQLLNAAITSANPYCWLFAVYGLNTAMRHSEILASRFDQIDFTQLRQFIPKAKGGRRIQPLTAELGRILEHERAMREDQQGWIFPSPHADSSSGHLATMDRPFNDAVKRASLQGKITPHTMRRTAITKLIKAGVDLPTVQKISGHKVLAMVLRYAHVHDTHIDKAMAALAQPLPLALPGEFKNSRAISGERPQL
jgi:integrase